MQKHRGIWLALLLALLAAAVLAPVAAMASEPQSVEINETNFPDATFRDYVKDFDKDGNHVLSPQEIAEVTEINVYNKSISDLTGIKYFTELETLMCYSNRLTSLDVSGCTELKLSLIHISPSGFQFCGISSEYKAQGQVQSRKYRHFLSWRVLS